VIRLKLGETMQRIVSTENGNNNIFVETPTKSGLGRLNLFIPEPKLDDARHPLYRWKDFRFLSL
jgi:hypothetical protein